MPIALLNMYAEDIEAVQAAEMLNQITAHSVGSGSLKKAEANKIMGQLQKRAQGQNKRRGMGALPPGVRVRRKDG